MVSNLVFKSISSLSDLERYSLLLMTMKGSPYRHSSNAYNHLTDEYSRKIGIKKRAGVEWFFCNTARAIRNNYKSFSTKLNNNYWSGNICSISARTVKSVLSWFQENGYVVVYLGAKDLKTDKVYPTIVKFTDKLYRLFEEDLTIHIASGVLDIPVIIKDRHTGNQIELPETKTVNKMQTEVKRYNNYLYNAKIEFKGQTLPPIEYKRSFTQDLYHGGRMYVHGGGVQLVPAEYRLEHITIGGEKVVELDYSSNHPSILYELFVKTNPQMLDSVIGIDPYGADTSFIECHRTNLGIDYSDFKAQAIRRYYKLALMLCINCNSFDSAVRTLGYEYHKDSQKQLTDRKFNAIIRPDNKRVIRSLAEHNEYISDNFYKDAGVSLQYIDSEIALRVIDMLIQQGVTVLCYHDSFVVRESSKDCLELAMRLAWKEILGNDYFCKISRK